MKYPLVVTAPPEVVTWRGPVTAPAGTVVLSCVPVTAVTRVLVGPVKLTWLPSRLTIRSSPTSRPGR